MNLITDRTMEDVLNKTSKGVYNASDLNRVEEAVQYLSFIASTLTQVDQLSTKTNWGEPGAFSANDWPVEKQMQRYLNNVQMLCESVGVSVWIPSSMKELNYQGANQIEIALTQVLNYVRANYKEYQYSGDLFAGEESAL